MIQTKHRYRVHPAVLLAVLFCWQCAILAQSSKLKFTRIGIEEGLSNATVTAITQDHEGFLWFGTEDGLNKYDGYTFTVFQHNPSDSSSLSSSFVNALCVDSSGNFWIGTNGGLSRYERASRSFTHIDRFNGFRPATAVSILDLKVDRDGLLWIATGGKGLYSFNPLTNVVDNVTDRLKVPNPGFSKYIAKIVVDDDNRVWGVSNVGILCVSSDRTNLSLYDRVAGDTTVAGFSTLFKSRTGRLFAGKMNGEICVFESEGKNFIRPSTSAAHYLGGIMSLFSDSQGRIWVGTFNQGLFLLDSTLNIKTQYFNNPNDPESVPSNRVYQIFEDRSGSLWVGTWKGGISVYHPFASKFQHFTHTWYDSSSLSDATIWSIQEDQAGALWVATDQGGVNRYDERTGRFVHFRNKKNNIGSISSNATRALCLDSTGNIWVATEYDGLNRYDFKINSFVRYQHNPRVSSSLYKGHTNTLLVDREGDLWVGGKSLDRLDHQSHRFIHYDSLLSMSGAEIMSLAEDSAGSIWIGMFPFGLSRLDKKKNVIQKVSCPAGMYNIHIDAAGTMWLGTFGAGLVRYNQSAETFESFTELDGLPSNFVKSILSDNDGNLWLGTSKGLSCFNPQSRLVRNYGPSDGVQGYEFRTGSCFKSRSGKLYFGGVNGFNAFYPDQLQDNPFVPPVVITRMNVSGKEYTPNADDNMHEIKLSYQQNALEFEFVGLNYTTSHENKYAYMLEAFDQRWVYSKDRRYVSHAHLDPGSYVFRVKASNNDGVWNETGAFVRFVIAPPFWATWWFISLLTIVTGASAYGLYRYRINKLLEVERTRSVIATDLHDDIGTSLTNIALFSDLAQRDLNNGSPDATRHLQKIAGTSRSLLDSMNDIVWSIKPENDALEQIILRMEDYAVEMLEENGIDLHVHIPDTLKTLKLPMTVRRNLFLIFKESVSNVLKHSHATRVEVIIAKKEKTDTRKPDIQILIKDNGKGFSQTAHRIGNGLNNMEMRARLLGGTVAVQSAPTKGTEIEIRFPVKSPI